MMFLYKKEKFIEEKLSTKSFLEQSREKLSLTQFLLIVSRYFVLHSQIHPIHDENAPAEDEHNFHITLF
jgi:hypothetical protein